MRVPRFVNEFPCPHLSKLSRDALVRTYTSQLAHRSARSSDHLGEHQTQDTTSDFDSSAQAHKTIERASQSVIADRTAWYDTERRTLSTAEGLCYRRMAFPRHRRLDRTALRSTVGRTAIHNA